MASSAVRGWTRSEWLWARAAFASWRDAKETTMNLEFVKNAILATRVEDAIVPLEELSIGDWLDEQRVGNVKLPFVEGVLEFFGLTYDHAVSDLLEAIDAELAVQ